MDAEVLREYVTLCSCQSFREAAQRCYISKSTLSAHIAGLEREIGNGAPVRLIERKDGFKLTDAGMIYLRAARSVLDLLDDAARQCRELVSPSDTVRVATGCTRRDLIVHLETLETVPFEFVDRDLSGPYLEQLDAGTADVLFTVDVDADEELRSQVQARGLSWAFAHEIPHAVVMMTSHPLASLDELSALDLTGAKVALLGPLSVGMFERSITGLFPVDPKFDCVYEPFGSRQNLMRLDLGDKITFMDADWAHETFSHRSDIVIRRIVDGAPLIERRSMVWNDATCSPNTRVFVEALRNHPLYAERPGSPGAADQEA